jgi:hypothetical protein
VRTQFKYCDFYYNSWFTIPKHNGIIYRFHIVVTLPQQILLLLHHFWSTRHPIGLRCHHLLPNFVVDPHCHAFAFSCSWTSPCSELCILCQRHHCLQLGPPLPFFTIHYISACPSLTTPPFFCLSSHLFLLCRYIQESHLMWRHYWLHLPQMTQIHCASIPTS